MFVRIIFLFYFQFLMTSVPEVRSSQLEAAPSIGSIRGFNHVGITVNNLEIMEEFYTKALGFKVVFSGEVSGENFSAATGLEDAHAKWITLQHDFGTVSYCLELLLFVHPKGKPIERPPINDFYINQIGFTVEDVESTVNRLETEFQMKFISTPRLLNTGAKIASGFDPEGNRIEIFELPKEQPSIPSFQHVGFTVSNLDRMVDFYTKALGFNVSFTGEANGKNFSMATGCAEAQAEWTYLEFQPLGSIPFYLEMSMFVKPKGKFIKRRPPVNDFHISHIAFQVEDIEKLVSRLETEFSMKFVSPPLLLNTGAKFAFGFDPDGNRIEFFELVSSSS